MRWYKRKCFWCVIAVAVILSVLWIISFKSVNRKFKIEKVPPYHVGETFQVRNLEITWNGMYIWTAEELLENRPSVTQKDLVEWDEYEEEFCVIDITVKNTSGEHTSTRITGWTISCADYGNGSAYITRLANPDLFGGLDSGQEEDAVIFYSVTSENREMFMNNKIKIYASLYPEEICLEGKLEEE